MLSFSHNGAHSGAALTGVSDSYWACQHLAVYLIPFTAASVAAGVTD